MESDNGKEDIDPGNATKEVDSDKIASAQPPVSSSFALPLADQTRSRKFTEKGQQFHCDRISQQLAVSYRKVRRQCALVSGMLQSTNSDMVKAELANLDKRLAEAEELNAQLLGLLNEDQQSEQLQKHEILDNEVFEVKHQVCEWLKINESERSSRGSSRSKGHASSRASSHSSHRSKGNSKGHAPSKCSNQSQSSSKSQTQRKLASLKAEEEVLLQIQEAKKEELECRVRLEAAKMESERRRLQKKIREAQIEDDVHTTEGTTAHKLNAAGLTVKSSVLASQTRVSGKPSDIKGVRSMKVLKRSMLC